MPTPGQPTPEQIRMNAIAEAADSAMKLLANHGALQGVGITLVIATGNPPMVLNSLRADLAAPMLAAAAQQIQEFSKANPLAGPVVLADETDLRAVRATRNGQNGTH
mgnify:CR=1 FL=1